MRELKFRAWKMHNGKLRRCVFSPFNILNYAHRHPEAPVLHNQDVNDIRDFVPDADVIEQYTGIKDKNGKKIYEGDIVRYALRPSRTTVVEWRSGEEEYYPCCTTSGFSLPYSEDGYEVIGNVHEDHELLEAKDVN